MSTSIARIQPPALAVVPGYSHVVVAPPGRTVYTAGQVALDPSGQVVGLGDVRAQTEQVFANLQAALAAAGATFSHVVKFTFFVLDVDRDLAIIREVRNRYIDPDELPASSLVQVARLFRPEFLIEVEAIAVIP